MVVYIYIYTC